MFQEDLATRLQREKAEQLKCLSSKLILFESRLIRKQKDINTLLHHREMIILRQQKIIDTLTSRLIENGLETTNSDLIDLESHMPDLDSLNDSDSAVIMEDIDSDSAFSQIIPRFRSASTDSAITVCRSISDAIDTSFKYSSARRSNGFLRRPEILETVYSVEEDGESEQNDKANSPNSVAQKRDAFAALRSEKIQTQEVAPSTTEEDEKNCFYDEYTIEIRSKTVDNSPDEHIYSLHDTPSWPYLHDLNGRLERDDCLNKSTRTPLNQVSTYNRVMSNHRSVTKPKDVKYKRINKAKSKSLEELRGRLRNWVEQGNKLAGVSLEQAQSLA